MLLRNSRIIGQLKMLKRNFPIFENFGPPAKKSNQKSDDEKFSGPIKIWSWNVAGLRACIKKAGHKSIISSGADIVFLQETKCPEIPAEIATMSEYPFKKIAVSTDKKGGYAGVLMLSKLEPIKFEIGLNNVDFDNHGRLITAEFKDFYIMGVYVLNSGQKLVNLDKRKKWEEAMRNKLSILDKLKPVIYAGDMNVAHEEIDLKNPAANRNKSAGFTDQERNDFTEMLNLGFCDVYRKMNPTKTGAYTYWTFMGNARSRNVGWRLDYFVISERIFDKVLDCQIHSEIMGSDHAPISLTIEF